MTELEELRIMETIRKLKARYFRFTDTKNWEGLATVFCEKGSLGGMEGDGTVGRMAVVELIRNGTAGVTTVHHGHSHEIWVDSDDQAHGIIPFEDLGFSKTTGEMMMHGYGSYHEEYRREDGEWRILSTRITRLAVLDRQPRV